MRRDDIRNDARGDGDHEELFGRTVPKFGRIRGDEAANLERRPKGPDGRIGSEVRGEDGQVGDWRNGEGSEEDRDQQQGRFLYGGSQESSQASRIQELE